MALSGVMRCLGPRRQGSCAANPRGIVHLSRQIRHAPAATDGDNTPLNVWTQSIAAQAAVRRRLSP